MREQNKTYVREKGEKEVRKKITGDKENKAKEIRSWKMQGWKGKRNNKSHERKMKR